MAKLLTAIRDTLLAREDFNYPLDGRIFDRRAPRGTPFPYVTLRRVSSNNEYDLAGETDSGQWVVQLQIWTTDPAQCETLGEPLRQVFSGKRGLIGLGDSEVFLKGSTLERDDDDDERPVDASDVWKFVRTLDFRMTFAQARAPA
jgi:hypothetical protein